MTQPQSELITNGASTHLLCIAGSAGRVLNVSVTAADGCEPPRLLNYLTGVLAVWVLDDLWGGGTLKHDNGLWGWFKPRLH